MTAHFGGGNTSQKLIAKRRNCVRDPLNKNVKSHCSTGDKPYRGRAGEKLSLQKNTVTVPTNQDHSRCLEMSPKDPWICSESQNQWVSLTFPVTQAPTPMQWSAQFPVSAHLR